MSRASWKVFVIAVLGVFSTQYAQAVTHRYNVTLDDNLSLMDVRLCFDGEAPEYLDSGDRSNASYIRDISLVSPDSSERPSINGGHIITSKLPKDSCIAYSVSLNGAIQDKKVSRVGDSLLVDIRTWLWRPRQLSPQDVIELYFNLPSGMKMTGPWQRLDSRPNSFRFYSTPINWSGRVAFGEVEKMFASALGKEIRICLVGKFTEQQKQDIGTWVGRAAANIIQVYGSFPVPDADILVVAVGDRFGSSAVPWAEVQRSGRPVVQFFINEQRPLKEFLADWTPTHEIAHMLHPSIEWRYKWVYEGLASYYQNLARARGGQLSELQAWQELYSGFQRGLNESQQSHWWGAPKYMEMYWRGAAVALMVDVALRKQSNHRQSLDTALDDFQQCCFSPVRTWSGQEFFKQMDKLTNTRLFSQIYGQYTETDHFPDMAPVFSELGIAVDGGKIQLEKRGLKAVLRQEMMISKPLIAPAR